MWAKALVEFVLTAAAAGLLGAAAMEFTLWAIHRLGAARADMVVALGSLVTKSLTGARRMGRTLHFASGLAFAALYALLLIALRVTTLPGALFLGLGLGFFHGMVVGIGLMYFVAERHPLVEFQEVDLALALAHLIAHVAFGGVVGLVVGLSPL